VKSRHRTSEECLGGLSRNISSTLVEWDIHLDIHQDGVGRLLDGSFHHLSRSLVQMANGLLNIGRPIPFPSRPAACLLPSVTNAAGESGFVLVIEQSGITMRGATQEYPSVRIVATVLGRSGNFGFGQHFILHSSKAVF
jgi:hypothetical protein